MTIFGQAAVTVVGLDSTLGDHDPRGVGVKAHAGQHHRLSAQLMQSGEQTVNVRLIRLLTVGNAGEEAGLGDIGQKDVGLGRKGLHSLNVGLVKRGIETAAVGHGGVYDAHAVRREAIGRQSAHKVDLCAASEISRIQCLKLNTLLRPMCRDRGHIVGQVAAGVALKSAGMSGQDGRWQNAGLMAAG